MSRMYALLVTEKRNFLCYSFCQIVLIMFGSYKNITKLTQFISQIILKVACVCLTQISRLFSLVGLICIVTVLLIFSFLQAEKPFENQTFNHLPFAKKERSIKEKKCIIQFKSVHCEMVSKRCWGWEKLEEMLLPLPPTQYEPPLWCGCHRQ